jgi:hypothetical protein
MASKTPAHLVVTVESCKLELLDPENKKALRIADGEKATATRVRRARAKGYRYERIAAAYGISVKAAKELEAEKGDPIYTGKGTTAHLAG